MREQSSEIWNVKMRLRKVSSRPERSCTMLPSQGPHSVFQTRTLNTQSLRSCHRDFSTLTAFTQSHSSMDS